MKAYLRVSLSTLVAQQVVFQGDRLSMKYSNWGYSSCRGASLVTARCIQNSTAWLSGYSSDQMRESPSLPQFPQAFFFCHLLATFRSLKGNIICFFQRPELLSRTLSETLYFWGFLFFCFCVFGSLLLQVQCPSQNPFPQKNNQFIFLSFELLVSLLLSLTEN